jgi:peptidoglycan/LPS O-acetylase OafA/YrhL
MTPRAAEAERPAYLLAPTARLVSHRPDIQGLRAIAVLMVVAFHAGLPVPGGFVGVDVFFVISGFVIAGSLHREWSNTGRIHFARFYMRRFKRLTPALALTVTVTMLLTAAVLSPLGAQQNAAKTAIGGMFISANVVIANTTGGYFSLAAETNPLLHVWSLSVEEQFYLGFPFLLAIGWAIARRGRRLSTAPLMLVMAVMAVSFLLSLVDESALEFPGSKDALGFYSPVPRAWEFAAGAALALAIAGRRGLAPRTAALSGTLGLIGLVSSLFLINGSTPFPGTWTLLPVVSTLLLIVAGWQNADNFVSRLLRTRPMVRTGDWSYSIYLWHWPFIVLAWTLWPGTLWAPVLAAIAAFVPAVASYRWVEQPLRGRSYSRRALGVLIAATMIPPLASAGLVLVASDNGYWSPPIIAYQNAGRPPLGTACGTAVDSSTASIIGCSFNTDAAGRPVYLVGDSHADHLSDGVIGAAEQLGRPAYTRIAPACQLFDGLIGDVGRDPVSHCEPYFSTTLSWLTLAEPGVVVISTSARPFWDPTIQMGLTRQSMSSDEDAKLQSLRQGLSESVIALQDAGHSVILVLDSPTFVEPHAYEPAQCSLPHLLALDCDRVMPLDVVEAQQAAVRTAMSDIALATGAATIDLRTQMCNAGGCPSRRGALVLYSDSNHLSADASATLIDEFSEVLSALR